MLRTKDVDDVIEQNAEGPGEHHHVRLSKRRLPQFAAGTTGRPPKNPAWICATAAR